MSGKTIPYLFILICILSGAFAQIMFKLGMSQLSSVQMPKLLLKMAKNSFILGGIFLYGISFVLWLLALKYFDVSFMYPLLSLAYIVVVMLSAVMLGEDVNISRWVGVILIVVGAILVGLNR